MTMRRYGGYLSDGEAPTRSSRWRRLGAWVVAWGLGSSACSEPPPSTPPEVPVEPAPAAVVEEPGEPGPAPEPAPEPVKDDGPLAPPPAAVQQQLAAIRADPPPAHLVRDTHYWISNEQSHFLWREAVQDKGGAFLGVATDQNYLLAGWARPLLLVLMDFDSGVVDLHRVYGVMFGRAESPEDLLAMWSEPRAAQVEAWLGEDLPAEQQADALAAFTSARSLVHGRLQAVDQQYRERGIPTFLSDAAQFEHLQTLWRNGRVVAVRGDLTADQTMADIAAALSAAQVSVGVLYLSNAEQYFRYSKAFRRNIIALPMADDGVVLRTHGWIQFRYVADEDYHYNHQPAPLFSEWMARGRAWGVPAMLEHRTKTKVRGVSVLDQPPPRRGR